VIFAILSILNVNNARKAITKNQKDNVLLVPKLTRNVPNVTVKDYVRNVKPVSMLMHKVSAKPALVIVIHVLLKNCAFNVSLDTIWILLKISFSALSVQMLHRIARSVRILKFAPNASQTISWLMIPAKNVAILSKIVLLVQTGRHVKNASLENS
jgi:hypothetical protein